MPPFGGRMEADYMKKKSLGCTNEMVSELCLGAMMLGTAVGKDDSYKVLDHFIDLGGNFIDTANCYSWWDFREGIHLISCQSRRA